MAKENTEGKSKAKRPTALKRDLQNEKRNANNRSYKAKVTTALRSYQEAVTKKETATVKTKLNNVFSLVDKGVKKGIFKPNKANRVKAQMAALSK